MLAFRLPCLNGFVDEVRSHISMIPWSCPQVESRSLGRGHGVWRLPSFCPMVVGWKEGPASLSVPGRSRDHMLVPLPTARHNGGGAWGVPCVGHLRGPMQSGRACGESPAQLYQFPHREVNLVACCGIASLRKPGACRRCATTTFPDPRVPSFSSWLRHHVGVSRRAG